MMTRVSLESLSIALVVLGGLVMVMLFAFWALAAQMSGHENVRGWTTHTDRRH